MAADFSGFLPVQIANYCSNEKYSMISAIALPETEHNISSLVNICNETEIYKWLFNRAVYDEKRAVEFLKWARLGWADGTHFVFIIIDKNQNIAGAIDIKSDKTDAAEIGYWVSENHSGLATNSLLKLKDVAAAAGYRRLYARVRPLNKKSIAVLERAGFRLDQKYRLNTEHLAHSVNLIL